MSSPSSAPSSFVVCHQHPSSFPSTRPMASVAAPRLSSPAPTPTPTPSSSSSSSSHTSLKPRHSLSFLAAAASTSSRRAIPRSRSAAPRSARSRRLDDMICRCQSEPAQSPDEGPGKRRWDSFLQDAVRIAVGRWEKYVESFQRSSKELPEKTSSSEKNELRVEADEDWDWERWKRHFEEVEEQDRLVSILKVQLHDAIFREDYGDAAKLKSAISAVAANDAVGNAVQYLNEAVKQEHYRKAAFIRDDGCAGLVGWWAGISADSADPFGRIVEITAEHGRYVARSYTSRQLASGKSGFPLFEVYLTLGNDGKYKQQAVYLQRSDANSKKNPKKSLDGGDSVPIGPSASGGRKESPIDKDVEASDDESPITEIAGNQHSDDESQMSEIAGFQRILQDMIPDVAGKVLKVVALGKVDPDLLSDLVDESVEDEEEEVEEEDDEEEDDDKDVELESSDSDDDLNSGSDSEEFEMNTEYSVSDSLEGPGDVSFNFVIQGPTQNYSMDMPPKDLVRVPARLDKKEHFSFSFSVIQDNSHLVDDKKECDSSGKSIKHANIRSADVIMSDLAKVIISKQKIPMKLLKDVEELIRLAINQEQDQPPLSGTVLFNRIDVPATSDPLSGLYITAPGVLKQEILYLRRKIGQWHEDGKDPKSASLEFYEYVEALKLTGDASVPAGQVAFRAKVGRHNQLPHKGRIPDEFGVVARYRGQGRIAEPGFRNPRWVDGELVIMDGKRITGDPVIAFAYWAPEFHFIKIFHWLKLQGHY